MNNVVPQVLKDRATQELDAISTSVTTKQEALSVVDSANFKVTGFRAAVGAFQFNFVAGQNDPKRGASMEAASKKIKRSTKPTTHDTDATMGEPTAIDGGYFGLAAYQRRVVGKKVWIVAGHPFETKTKAKFWAASYVLARKTEQMDRDEAMAHANRALINMLAMTCGLLYADVANVTFA